MKAALLCILSAVLASAAPGGALRDLMGMAGASAGEEEAARRLAAAPSGPEASSPARPAPGPASSPGRAAAAAAVPGAFGEPAVEISSRAAAVVRRPARRRARFFRAVHLPRSAEEGWNRGLAEAVSAWAASPPPRPLWP